ncbi:mycofactocin precursor [Janibacter limosus]|uniref:Mycofactocin n=1 Tax=Janibacter limosus TaxID=53458 RepID=A0A4P6MZW6_9MICO|nr:mycofactocin precursor [Janibacter limosus]
METTDTTTAESEELTAEMLVEEVSIDGMCGVY